MIRILGTTLAALLGLAFGSFLNVCLSRWPEGESVVKPRSHCRNCARALTWWENIPLLSWLALRGRCRTCGVWIGWRYPLVESAVGLLWAVVTWQALSGIQDTLSSGSYPPLVSFSPGFLFLFAATVLGKILFCWALVGLATLDAEHLWLPDVLTLSGLALGVAVTFLRGDFLQGDAQFGGPKLLLLLRVAFAILASALLILLIRWTYKLIRHREGIGLGDAKLMAMLGAWLGLPGALLSFAIGVLLGAIFALILLAVPSARRESETWTASKLPLGTFLCIGGIVSALWGQPIINAYLRWAGF